MEAVKSDILEWVIGTIGFRTLVILGAALTLVRGAVRRARPDRAAALSAAFGMKIASNSRSAAPSAPCAAPRDLRLVESRRREPVPSLLENALETTMTEAASRSVAIDVIADVACPWCYIGKRRLDQVIAAFPGIVAHIRWRPYQIEPYIPPEGLDRDLARVERYGAGSASAVTNEVAAAGREVGVAFAFEKIARTPNTLDAHRLVRLAKIGGLQGKMVERLFKAFFCEGRDIGNRRTLIELGIESGFDRDTLEGHFARRDDITLVQEELATTRRLGVTTVPFYIFGEDVVVPGLQSKEMLAAALAKALEPQMPHGSTGV